MLTRWCTVGLPRHPMPVYGDSHSSDTTHSLVVGLVVIWDATRHVFCAVQPQETCLTALQCALFSQICGRSGATGGPSSLTEAASWIQQTWLFIPGSHVNTPASVRAHGAFVGQVCERFTSCDADPQRALESSNQLHGCALLSAITIALNSVEDVP